MNKKAFLAICIAVFMPVIGYMLIKFASEKAVVMPRHYLLDSTISTVKDGKLSTDSIWHVTKNIHLVNQLGDSVGLYDIQGKIIVADFFFTSCGSICPTLTRNMVKLQRSFLKGGDDIREKIDTSIVQFVSFTVDPERDSVARLKAYADRYGVNHDNWWMLTGPKDSIYKFAFEEMKVDKFDDSPIDSNFVHTNRYVLIDRNFVVRGYYNGLDSSSISKLAKDIGLLMLEKDEKHPEKLPFDPLLMGVFFAIALVVVVVVISILFKKKKA
jgi:protein SCO1/2